MDFSNTSGIKSPFSPRIKQSSVGRRSVGNASAKKNLNKMEGGEEMKGEVIYKSPQITLETYGPPLPVMVTEALAFANSEVTIKTSPCGWCWLVVGRRILAWPLDASAGAAANTAARELILPQTDLAHKSDLVDIFYEDDEQHPDAGCFSKSPAVRTQLLGVANMKPYMEMQPTVDDSPSCIGVSPEGVIRYWPSVRHSGVYSEVSAELGGQECAVLQASAPVHLLATTTCTLGAVHHDSVEGRSSVWYSALSAGGGWLGSLGRRVSLLFFGAAQQQADIKLSGLVVIRPGGVLTEESTGLCALATGGASPTLQLFGKQPLANVPLPQLHTRHTQGMGTEPGPRDLSVLDMKVTDAGEIVLLIAFTNRELRYLISTLNVCVSEPRVTWACHVGGVRIDSAPRLLTSGDTLVLYTANCIAVTTLFGAGQWSCVEWGGAGLSGGGGGGGLRGGGVAGRRIVLFDCRHSPIALTHARSVMDTPLQSPSVTDVYTGNLSLLEIDPYEIRKVGRDACGIVKCAFLFHLRRDARARDELLASLFPHLAVSKHPNATHSEPHGWQGSPKTPSSPQVKAEENREVDAMLDRTVYKIALELLDDIPTGDPRWQAESGAGRGGACSVPLGASCALGAGAQLRDKQLALSLLAHLHIGPTPLHQATSSVTTDDGTVMPTMAALGALAERLAAAQHLHEQHHPALDKAIQQVVSSSLSDEDPSVVSAHRSGLLSARDVCFRRASLLPSLLHQLTRDTSALTLLASTLREMHTVRARWGRPAPAAPPAHTLTRAIVDMLPNVLNDLKSDTMPVSSKGQTLSALCSLADLLLDETACLPDNPFADKIFNVLVEAGETERALLLAEKYKHFDALIEMCVKHYGMERLYTYIDKYIDEGVCERAFSIVRGIGGREWSRLLQHAATHPRLADKLPTKLTAHDDANILVLLSSGKYLEASESLVERAESDFNSDHTVTVAASLSKLCALVCTEGARRDAALQRSARALCVTAHLHALPHALRGKAHTAHRDPAALVQLYIDSEEGLTEVDYKQALDLTDLVDDLELREELRLQVWCASIVRDSWLEPGAGGGCGGAGGGDMDAARAHLRDKTFFRLIDLVQLCGGELSVLLPPCTELVTSRTLAPLVSDPRALYLLKYGYETLCAGAPADTDVHMQC